MPEEKANGKEIDKHEYDGQKRKYAQRDFAAPGHKYWFFLRYEIPLADSQKLVKIVFTFFGKSPAFLWESKIPTFIQILNVMPDFSLNWIWIILAVLFVFSGLVTVKQGFIDVITMFGKYRRIMHPGLNFKIPFLEKITKRVSIQNRSVELEFQAVTQDQANVYFKSMLLFAVQNAEEETIKKVAFKFISEKDLMQALVRTIEGTIRAFVATKRQAEILALRKEIVEYVKDEIDHLLSEWGYHLLDLQINDITFDKAILESMSKVVASNNLKAAAENEGQALLITKTKAAEAEGNAIKIAAMAEREAAQLRGQGVSLFRQEVAK